ncbi:uncharacterized protein C15orf39 homolog isoform X2 [Alligator mississippiensis]|nr:uncharacterized protein C15orf39 homolog isoform X2 [Alligator mississippiensis]
MAGKRHLESLDPMIYNKIPRLETEPNRILPGGLCKSSPLPSPGSENHLTYKGSYFAYPLQNHDGTESLAHWTSAAAYMQYAGNTVNQHLRTDGAVMNCLLYRREPESMGGCLPSSGAEKGKDSMVRDLLMAREKWANHVGHQDPLQQAQGHAFPLPKPVVMNKAVAQAPTGCATLAVPKPVYRTPICYVDPRTSVSLGSRMESLQKRSMEMEWTLPAPVSSGHHPHLSEQHCGMAVHKKAHHPEPNFLPPHQGTGVPTKETLASTVGFSPYSAAFEKYRAPKNTSFLEANYPAVYNQKNCTEVVGSNLTQNAWSKMYPSTTSPGLHSPASVYQERPPPCYPLSHYPLPLQKQTLLYHQEGPHAEKQNGSLSTLPSSGSYKGFGFLGSGDPRAFPSSYLRQQLPQSYYPGPLESYVYRAASSIPTASPTSKPSAPSREPELQKNTSCKMDFLPQSPSFPFASPDLALYNTSLGSSHAHHDQHVDDTVPTFHGTQLVKESPRSKQMASHHSAFQAVHSLNRLTEVLPKGEMGYGLGLCPAHKPSLNGLEPSHPDKRRSSLTCRETKPRSTRTREAEPGAPIVIADSPVPHHHQSKWESSKVRDFTEGLVASPPIVSSEERQKGLRNARGSPPSPPMPVINNVFSLAPYRDYLEGPSEGPGESPCSKNQQREGPAIRNTVNTLGSGDSAKPVSEPSAIQNVSEKTKLLPAEKEAESRANKPGKMRVKEGDCYKTSSEPKQLLHSLSMKSDPEPRSGRQSAPAASGSREVIHNEVVLDLSLKKKLAKSDDAGRHAGQTEGMPKREEGEQEREASLKKQEVCEGSKTQALPLQAGNGSRDKSNFHSSAAFMFKKFKILKSLPAGTVPSVQPSSPSMQQSYPIMTPLTSAPMQPSPKAAIQANTQQLQITCLNLKLPDISEALPPSAPEVSPVLGEANVSLPSNCESPAQQTSSSQYFTSLHVSLCNVISYSVCGAPPELLKEWLKRAEPDELKERPKSPPKHKNGSRILEAQKPTKSKEIWLDFKDASMLLSKLLSQLETFMFTRKCPFPHVVRAGAIFIPIHVVKEKLFPKLLGLSVDQVLQEHKVELRPTTLSEEKLLRDLELKCCTSRMLKLLALKQLPDIYPDLLTLHWHDCIKQQLGPSSQAVQQASK